LIGQPDFLQVHFRVAYERELDEERRLPNQRHPISMIFETVEYALSQESDIANNPYTSSFRIIWDFIRPN
jgi:hypothetical protein